MSVQVSECKHWAMGGKGTTDLAKKVVKTCKNFILGIALLILKNFAKYNCY